MLLRARYSQLCLGMTYLTILCLAVAVILSPTPLSAQGTGGRILGRIADQIGRASCRERV